MNKQLLFIGVLACCVAPLAYAQNLVEVRNAVTTDNVYAQQRIELLTNFETTTVGFKAEIKLPEATAGRWSAPLLWTPYQRAGTGTPITGIVGIHTHVTPDGKVLSWEGHNSNTQANTNTHTSHAYVWNPNLNSRNGNQFYPNVYSHYDNLHSNIFCSGHSFLANGHLLVAGGHYSDGDIRTVFPVDVLAATNNIKVPGYIGLKDVNTFNYAGNTSSSQSGYVWQSSFNDPNFILLPATLPTMSQRRWYPTATTLADGRVLVVAGQQFGDPAALGGARQAESPEVYSATTNAWQTLPASATRRLPLYPWMFQAPDGRMFNAGPNRRTDFLNPTATAIAGTAPDTWSNAPGLLHQHGRNTPLPAGASDYDYTERGAGTAVMYEPGRILIVGGSGPAGVTATTELIDLNEASPAWQYAAPMHLARANVNSTLLADGTVLATGGVRRNTTSDTDAALSAELWTPPTAAAAGGSWATMRDMAVPRLYHSTAVLLPDATVLSTGGGQGGGFADHPDYQIFTPPYLCRGLPRPEISSAPQAVVYGQYFTISSPNAPNILNNGGRATLVRLPSVTHSFDMNQRFINCRILPGNNATDLRVRAPNSPNMCPPGHYMLFLLDSNGTPSHASIIAIDATACTTGLSIAQTNPFLGTYASCSRTTTFVASGGPAGSTYVWTVNGVAYGTTGTSNTIDLVTTNSAPTVQVTVALAGNAGCGASSALTSYFPGCSEAQ